MASEPEVELESSAAAMKEYERIAAALIASLPNEDHQLLLEFGAEPGDLKGIQSVLKAKGVGPKTQRSGASSAIKVKAATEGPLTLAVNTPRSKRRKNIPDRFLPKVAIVGRPNVGKSALFNRIAGTSIAVVYDEPGVTRDRLYTRAFWGNKEFVLIDTGGLMSDAAHLSPEVQKQAIKDISAEGLPLAIERQAAAGVAEADSLVLLVDGMEGLQAGDREILQWLRQNHPTKKVVLAVNKCESSAKADLMASEFWELGLEPLAVSAISGTGTGEMLDALVATLPPPLSEEEEEDGEEPLSIAIVGRPNVGKSSLLNAICGEERSIVCDMSGTTRDAVDTELTLPGGQKLVLIDTAGIRKRNKVADSKDGPESISVDRALKAMTRAEVAVIVVDSSEGITQQDFRLSELAANTGSAVVVVANKWDRIDRNKWATEEKYAEEVEAQLRPVSWATVACTDASLGTGVDKVVKAILRAGKEHRRRVSTATLNMVMKEATTWKAPPTQRGSMKKGKIYYATQAGIKPPSFVFFVNDSKLISDDYKRYMERQLRENVGFDGTPLRLIWRGKPEKKRDEVPEKKTLTRNLGAS